MGRATMAKRRRLRSYHLELERGEYDRQPAPAMQGSGGIVPEPHVMGVEHSGIGKISTGIAELECQTRVHRDRPPVAGEPHSCSFGPSSRGRNANPFLVGAGADARAEESGWTWRCGRVAGCTCSSSRWWSGRGQGRRRARHAQRMRPAGQRHSVQIPLPRLASDSQSPARSCPSRPDQTLAFTPGVTTTCWQGGSRPCPRGRRRFGNAAGLGSAREKRSRHGPALRPRAIEGAPRTA